MSLTFEEVKQAISDVLKGYEDQDNILEGLKAFGENPDTFIKGVYARNSAENTGTCFCTR